MLNEDRARELVEHLSYLFRAVRRGVECHAREHGQTVPQRIVLGQLARYGALSVKELSEKVELSHSTVSGIVDRLERKGLAKRVQDQQDRRITKVTITDLARHHMNNWLSQQMFSGIVEVYNNAADGEQIKILDGLTALRQLLDEDSKSQVNTN